MTNAHKKNVDLYVFIGSPEVLDYLFSPITTYKPTLESGSAVALVWGKFLKVSKFQENQISYFAFSYSMMCIKIYAVLFHRQTIS